MELSDLPSMIVLVAGIVIGGLAGAGGFAIWNAAWDNPHVYAAGEAAQLAADEAAADKQQQDVNRVRADIAQQQADVEAILRKAQIDDQLQLEAVDAAAAADPDGDRICLPADVVHHIRELGGS